MKIGYGSCPATCGELVQGMIGKEEYISSYCVDMYSNAKIVEKKFMNNKVSRSKIKSLKAVSNVFEKFGYSRDLSKKIDLHISSEIPVGKGMASSTADIGASVLAALDFIGEKMSPEEISILVSKIEPTDSIYFKEVCIFNPIKGIKKKSLGFLKSEDVIILEPNDRINTIKIRKDIGYYNVLKKNRFITKKSFEMLELGIKKNNIELIKKACMNSAFANEEIKKTPYLREILDLSKKHNCGFVNISHTGTVIGIAADEKTDIDKLKYELSKCRLGNYYNNIYSRKIVSGGACNTKIDF